MAEGPKIKTEKEREAVISKLPAKEYEFCEHCEIENVKDYLKLVKTLTERAETLIEDIDQLREKQGKTKIRNFTIGKTYAPKCKNKEGWKVKGIRDRWYTYSNKGYDFLLAFAVLTRENVPANVKEPFKNQQMLALGIENQLIQHFCFVKADPRLDNKSLHPGKASSNYAGQVIYLAVRYSTPEDNEEEESEDNEEEGSGGQAEEESQ